jgi:uncharacterized SAM-binding protein YcdF (DUF218 family)
LFPLPLSILLLLAGLAIAWRGRHLRWTRGSLVAGLVLLVASSTAAFSNAVMRPLENRYKALGPEDLAAIDWGKTHSIVVFSGCTVGFAEDPVTRQVEGPSLARMVEGVRLYNACPDCKVILSGGVGCDREAPVETLSNWRFATEFGIAPQDLIIERASMDTGDQARILSEMLGDEQFLLVTSASNMPRTMALFEASGVTGAIPAPTDYATGLYSILSREAFGAEPVYPNAQSLWTTERAVYEYLGLLVAWAATLF